MSHIANLAGKDPLSRRYFLEQTAKLSLGVSVGSSMMPGAMAQAAAGGGKAKNLIYIFFKIN